jgi:uncharacterized membrane protein YhaH (DUF805 family)
MVNRLLTYLSFRGRANRQRYWTAQLLLVVLSVIATMLSLGMMDIVPLVGLIFLPSLLVVVIALLANGARRLHERGKSAWWLLLFAGVSAFFSLLRQLAAASDGGEVAGIPFRALGLPFELWWFVEMGCLKGTTGPNKYGDDPLQPVAEAFA